MSDPNEKSRRLADWQARLDSEASSHDLEVWSAELRHEVNQMKAQALIDPEEAHDLRELVDAAYSHFAEEAIGRDAN